MRFSKSEMHFCRCKNSTTATKQKVFFCFWNVSVPKELQWYPSSSLKGFKHLGSPHVLWQVSFGFWVTWSISSWQEYYKSFFLPKSSDQGQNFFFCLPATNAQIFCKMNPLNSLRFTSHQKNWDKCLLFVLNDEIDQNTKLPSAK